MSLPQPPARHRWIPSPRIASGIAVTIVIVGLVSQTIRPAGAPSWSFPVDSPGPAASAADWRALSLAPYVPAAELIVDQADASGLASDTVFTLRSRTGTPAVSLAAGLTASPAVKFRIAAGPTLDVATLQPVAPLATGARYRFRLADVDGSLAGTWSFRVAGPLQVVGRLPEDHSTGVPISTGVEVTFDQDSPIDFAAHFSITPEADGRFEVHDRTWVFVPTKPLAAGTLYTYTVRAGVGMAGSSQTLEHDVSVSFETQAATSQDAQVRFDRGLFEVRTGSQPVLGIWTSADEESSVVLKSLRTDVYRLPTLDVAARAAATFGSNDEWLLASAAGLFPTEGLTRIDSFTARLTDHVDGWYVLHVPAVLDPGWYLIVVPRDGRDAQAVIQVTDLATYALSSATRTVVWLNDLATSSPVADATVRLASGAALGRTNAQGLLAAPTPAELLSQAEVEDYWAATANVLTIRTADGRGIVASLGMPSSGHYPYNGPDSRASPSPWWVVLDTDRSVYRSTDTVHAWGYVRTRDGRSVPDDLELRFIATGDDAAAPITTATVKPTARGAFVADLALRDVPTSEGYAVELYAGGKLVATHWLNVAVIRKPAFAIDVTTDRHAYIAGDTIHVGASVKFFDGTSSPGLDLTGGSWDWNNDRFADSQALTTDALGSTAFSVPAIADGPEGYSTQQVVVVPTHPEEGEIRASVDRFVFPSTIWLAADAAVRDGRLHLAGAVSKVDLARLDRELATTSWPDDPAGAPIAGQTVSIKVIHVIPVRRLVRTEYDYVEKKTVPIYEYHERTESLGTYTARSDSDGRFTLSLTVPNPDHSYRTVISTRDAKGRLSQASADAWKAYAWNGAPALHLDGPDTASLGQPVDFTVRALDGSAPAGTYLFLVGRDGIRDVVLSDGATLTRQFQDRDLPGYTVRAVRLSATGLEEVNDLPVRVAIDEKRVHVTLTPDRERYQPGGLVTLAIRTTGPDGRPIAADVVVRVTDQKLFAIDTAQDPDTLNELMASVGSGFMQSYVSEFAPRTAPGDGGYGGAGGGGRDDFRDSLAFELVSTDARGRASVSFTLSDDLTSWHVSASAVTATLDAGDGVVFLPVGLPFFVEATLAPDYLAGEQPVLRLRAYGEGLRTGDPVRFTVSAPSLGINGTIVTGRAFQAVRLPLGALPAGDHTITIDGERIGDAALRDRLTRTVHVVPNRLTMLRTTYTEVSDQLTPPMGIDLTTYLVTDAGRGALIPILQDLAATRSARFDRLAAAEAARALLTGTFEVPLDGLAPTGFDPTSYQRWNGIALLPYSSPEIALGAEAALVVPDELDAAQLRGALRSLFDPEQQEMQPTREQSIMAYAGLAGLGENTYDELHDIASTFPDLSVRERLWLALGYLASGDEASAREIERDLLATGGRQLGPWVQLEVGSRSEEATALMLLLSAGLGDPVATRISRYLADHPSAERSFAFEQLGYARSMLERLPREPGSFAWTVDGQRHVETLDPGASFTMTLTPAQQRTLTFERLGGALLLTTTAVASATPADLPHDPDVTITRRISPAGGATEDQIVHVTITLTLKRSAGNGCYTVTDLVPSGLAPVAAVAGWPGDESQSPAVVVRPWEIDGQRVSWCIASSEVNRPLVYSARVVSPGTYTWEPAVIQFDIDPTVGASTPTISYTIR